VFVLLVSVQCSRGAGYRATETSVDVAVPAPIQSGATPTAHPALDHTWRVLGLQKPLLDLLDSGEFGQTPVSHRIVALSFLADACESQARQDPALHDGAAACIARCLELAQKTRPRKLDAEAANEGLWLSHLNLILGARDALGPCLEPELHRAIATALARRSLREPTFHVPSYASLPFRWPADQTATLASLARFDRAHASHLVQEPAKRWREYILLHAMDRDLQLPWSEATGKAKGARHPRGCAHAWQTRYLREFDPELASVWWQRFKDKFFVDRLALVGFREWPPGRDRQADLDSGPIIQGLGSAATALALVAARVMGDRLLAARLEGTASMVETLAINDKALARVASTPLAAAIRHLGRHACPTKSANKQ
jgi:hypothetical protein